MQTASNTIANAELLKNITNVLTENADKNDATLKQLNTQNQAQMVENNKANDRRMEANTKRLVKQLNLKSKATSLILRPTMTTRNSKGAKKLDTDSLSSMDEEDFELDDVSLSSENKENRAEVKDQNVE
jgi:dTDP-D-glucose 4,6-dehydratase